MTAIASDHAGFKMKEVLINYLKEEGFQIKDFGTNNEESCDYPIFAKLACNAVVSGECENAILICGTGIGMSIAANKIKGIRAAVCGDELSAEYTRLHNDANVLCLGARVIDDEKAKKLSNIFLKTPFDGGKHLKRISMLEE